MIEYYRDQKDEPSIVRCRMAGSALYPCHERPVLRTIRHLTVPGSPVNRAGFTLVEVLVVIAIIAILVSLTAAAVFQVIVGQGRSNTETNMKRVYKQLDDQVKTVLSKADTEDIPANVVSMAGGDPGRAKVIWRKLRLKQEFPMTFAEALAPYMTYANASCPFLTASDLPPLPAFNVLPNIKANTLKQPFLESSICLVLALQQNHGGAS